MTESNQTESEQPDGDLIAHIHNDDTSTIQSELGALPDLAQELAALQELDALLQTSYGGSALPDPQDLIDVLTDQATPAQKLIVAAYERNSERGKREMDALRAELARSPLAETATESSGTVLEQLARFVATPLAFNMGLRAAGGDGEQMTFEATDIQAMVTIRIVPPSRERWRIEGYVTQNYEPVPNAQIGLRVEPTQTGESVTESITESATDSDGFFEFNDLAAGEYTIEAALSDGIVIVPELNLTEEDG